MLDPVQRCKDILRSGLSPMFLPCAMNKLVNRCSSSVIEGSDSFGSIQFASGHCEQVYIQFVHVNFDFPAGLRGVGVERDSFFFGDLPNLLDGFNGAVSLFACIRVMRLVSFVIDFRTSDGFTKPYSSTGKYVVLKLNFSSRYSSGFRMAGCSICDVIMCLPFLMLAKAVPNKA